MHGCFWKFWKTLSILFTFFGVAFFCLVLQNFYNFGESHMRTYEIINYDVWGDPDGGFSVNDSYRTGIFIEINEDDSDKIILKKLKEVGFLKKTVKYICFEIDGDLEYSLYVDHVSQKNGRYPFCELRAIDE
jgi:hypothetical protein